MKVERLVGTRRIAREYGLSQSAIRRMARRGLIPCTRLVTGTLRFSRRAVRDAIGRPGGPARAAPCRAGAGRGRTRAAERLKELGIG